MPVGSKGHDMSTDALYERVARILEQARGRVARTVNSAMVQAYWHVGREIVEVEQHGAQRASYGDEVITQLSARLAAAYGRGFSVRNLWSMRQFYLVFSDGSALAGIPQTVSAESARLRLPAPPPGGRGKPTSSRSVAASAIPGPKPPRPALTGGEPAAPFPPELAWSHYLVLLRVTKDTARAFYEIEAARGCWSVRQLERQIGACLFERLANHRDPEEVLALARRGQEVAKPSDVIKDPFVLEFLDVEERARLHERDLEQAIIDRLEAFLLELGKGFCFVGRQMRLTVEGDHFYVDLVFYNRLLRCFVLVDLKLGKLSHQDLGQMLMYVNYYDRAQRAEHENKTIGIVLCSEQNEAMVKITLPDNDQIIAATYLRYLPTEAELQAELQREREKIERELRLSAPLPERPDREDEP
jgi:predicted nuclease of restriction endonuclease-like (RecB) superfamily